MINLLPPAIKDELRYARRNATLVRMLTTLLIVLVVLSASLLGGRLYLDRQASAADAQLASTQRQIDADGSLERSATTLSSRVKSIETILGAQAHFSQLLDDLSQYMPRGTVISSIGLTGDDKKPVKLVVSAVDYETAVAFRDSLTKSKRVSAADIQSIQSISGDGNTFGGRKNYYQVTVTFGFNKGAAR